MASPQLISCAWCASRTGHQSVTELLDFIWTSGKKIQPGCSKRNHQTSPCPIAQPSLLLRHDP